MLLFWLSRGWLSTEEQCETGGTNVIIFGAFHYHICSFTLLNMWCIAVVQLMRLQWFSWRVKHRTRKEGSLSVDMLAFCQQHGFQNPHWKSKQAHYYCPMKFDSEFQCHLWPHIVERTYVSVLLYNLVNMNLIKFSIQISKYCIFIFLWSLIILMFICLHCHTEMVVEKKTEMSKNAQFRAIQPSPSILSFVEDNVSRTFFLLIYYFGHYVLPYLKIL